MRCCGTTIEEWDVLLDELRALRLLLDLLLFCAVLPERDDRVRCTRHDGRLVAADCECPDLEENVSGMNAD